MREAARRLQVETKTEMLNEIARLTYVPPRAPQPVGALDPGDPPKPGPGDDTSLVCAEDEVVYITYVPQENVVIRFAKSKIDTPDDIEEYLNAVRRAYLDALKAGKHISITNIH